MIYPSCIFPRVNAQLHYRNWHYSDLAEKSGVEYNLLCAMMNGRQPLLEEEAQRIYQALKCQMPIEKLFAKKFVCEQMAKSEKELLEGYRSLSKEGKAFILKVLRNAKVDYPQVDVSTPGE